VNNLYIVATPIGNLQDITLRAANILLETGVVVAESSSKAGMLLAYIEKTFDKKRNPKLTIISFSENEEENKIPLILNLLATSDAALISEAGTPLISDPGYKLISSAIKKGVNIVPIPGPNAAIAALSVSGLPTDKFLFLGFLPKKRGKQLSVLENVREIKNITSFTVVIYESPHRLVETLENIIEVFGNVDVVVARELTKIHEELRRETIKSAIEHFKSKEPRGEFVILV